MHLPLQQAFSAKAIMIAGGLACLIYVTMLGLTLINGDAVLQTIEQKMSAQNIAFDRPNDAIEAMSAEALDGEVNAKDLSALIGFAGKALPAAPYDGLIEDAASGPLPQIGKNKLTPFDAYKKPYVYDVKKPIIALGIKGIGFSSSLYAQTFDRLSPQVSLILSSYLPNVHDIQKEVRNRGYETWLEIPFENENFPYSAPGSKGILANAGLQFNQQNYESILASTSGYAGVVGYTDQAFANSVPVIEGIIGDVYRRGLGFFELNTDRDAMSSSITPNRQAAYLRNDYYAGNNKSVRDAFTELKRISDNNIAATGVIDVSPEMMESFHEELSKAIEDGYEIVPLSAVADAF